MRKINIAIFVSGEGTNCENLIRHFQSNENVGVSVVVSSKPEARAIERAQRLGVPAKVITRREFSEDPRLVLKTVEGCDLIVLAGFLLFISDYLLERFHRRIINIHPSLLPKYGGKGMWGHHVHEAVKAAGETETGITIHYVDARIDAGECIAQYRTALSPLDTPDDIAAKVHALEKQYFPKVVEDIAMGLKERQG